MEEEHLHAVSAIRSAMFRAKARPAIHGAPVASLTAV